MIVTINKLEVASEVAQVMLKYLEENTNVNFPNGIYLESENETRYTEEAQDVFNNLYGIIEDVIYECKIQ